MSEPCRHLRVSYAKNWQSDDEYTDSWWCKDCDARFGPLSLVQEAIDHEAAKHRAEVERLGVENAALRSQNAEIRRDDDELADVLDEAECTNRLAWRWASQKCAEYAEMEAAEGRAQREVEQLKKALAHAERVADIFDTQCARAQASARRARTELSAALADRDAMRGRLDLIEALLRRAWPAVNDICNEWDGGQPPDTPEREAQSLLTAICDAFKDEPVPW